MLKQRLMTAAWLAPLMLAGLFGLEGGAFALFTGGIVLVGAWEWANLAGITERPQQVGVTAIAAAFLMLLWWLSPHGLVWVLWLGVIGWAVNLYWVIGYPGRQTQWQGRGVRLAMGAWVLVPCWAGLNALRSGGESWLLFVLLLVWGADIGAYFFGKRFGRHRLAPDVSPGKTWEGVAGALLSTLILAIGFGIWSALEGLSILWLVVISMVVALVSVLGDLLESMLKRHRGIKDSSGLLPGHGGILDRVDSLTAAIPVFALLYTLVGLP